MPICLPAMYQGLSWGTAVCVMYAILPLKELTVLCLAFSPAEFGVAISPVEFLLLFLLFLQ